MQVVLLDNNISRKPPKPGQPAPESEKKPCDNYDYTYYD